MRAMGEKKKKKEASLKKAFKCISIFQCSKPCSTAHFAATVLSRENVNQVVEQRKGKQFDDK